MNPKKEDTTQSDAYKAHKARVLKQAREMAKDYKPCPECGSNNVVGDVGEGLSKLKPTVYCKDCGELLAWG